MGTDPKPIIQSQKFKDDSIVAHFSDGLKIDYSKGETIINNVEEPEGIYLIVSGFVKAFSVSKEGFGNLLLIHEKGEFIPLPWALDGAHNTGLYYEAMSEVSVIRSSKDKLRTAMGSNSWLAQEILNQTVNIVNTYTKRIQTLELRSAKERIAAELIYLCERFGETNGKQVHIVAPITHQDLSDSINMSRETASRALELLFEQKLLSQVEHELIVLDLVGLQKSLDE